MFAEQPIRIEFNLGVRSVNGIKVVFFRAVILNFYVSLPLSPITVTLNQNSLYQKRGPCLTKQLLSSLKKRRRNIQMM